MDLPTNLDMAWEMRLRRRTTYLVGSLPTYPEPTRYVVGYMEVEEDNLPTNQASTHLDMAWEAWRCMKATRRIHGTEVIRGPPLLFICGPEQLLRLIKLEALYHVPFHHGPCAVQCLPYTYVGTQTLILF